MMTLMNILQVVSTENESDDPENSYLLQFLLAVTAYHHLNVRLENKALKKPASYK